MADLRNLGTCKSCVCFHLLLTLLLLYATTPKALVVTYGANLSQTFNSPHLFKASGPRSVSGVLRLPKSSSFSYEFDDHNRGSVVLVAFHDNNCVLDGWVRLCELYQCAGLVLYTRYQVAGLVAMTLSTDPILSTPIVELSEPDGIWLNEQLQKHHAMNVSVTVDDVNEWSAYCQGMEYAWALGMPALASIYIFCHICWTFFVGCRQKSLTKLDAFVLFVEGSGAGLRASIASALVLTSGQAFSYLVFVWILFLNGMCSIPSAP